MRKNGSNILSSCLFGCLNGGVWQDGDSGEGEKEIRQRKGKMRLCYVSEAGSNFFTQEKDTEMIQSVM